MKSYYHCSGNRKATVQREYAPCWFCGHALEIGNLGHIHRAKEKSNHPLLKAYKLNKGAKNVI